MHRVFVYGTLKKCEPNHHWLTDTKNGVSKFIGDGETLEKYPLVIATKYNIPFLLYKPGTGNNVKGEIYEVDEKMLKNLDILEDHPNFYERDQYLLKNLQTNETNQCWVYFLKKFQPYLLEKEFYTSYSNNGSHGLKYSESNNESTLDDL
ncbi:putative gamma-glutamylcyclotransferase CG2811 isoform X2 [Chrysoperla carnea]|uniref:putative gamma-glutamylcyclotransferase CG2811 isoform X2 n=1 Tax=Chrysoperla carnea TaxID=189513 RepID=UPI001D0932DC|nr:putative gamma-glutamylcyclotransferase CG2811 isoform X2 [Chrysoperla carnea]